MNKFARYFMLFVVAVQFFFAIAFYLQWPIATGLWPFEGTTPVTFIFISSIFAAAAAPTLWAVMSRNEGALAGIGLDYMAILLPVAVLSFQLGFRNSTSNMFAYGLVCLVGVVFGLSLFLWSVRKPLDTTIPIPPFLRLAFIGFIIALLIVGGRLVFKVPGTIPWTITPDLSIVMGWMFLGAAIYFAYGLLRPSWRNAAGQMIGFLAYDLVLIYPFVTRLGTTSPENKLGMIVYTIILLLSGSLAIYYLFINKPTRLRSG